MKQGDLSGNFAEINKTSVNQITRTIQLSGEFTLILACCNYARLRWHIIGQIKNSSSVKIREISLPDSVETLYTFIRNELENEALSEALMVLNIESVERIDNVLSAANQVRDEFSNDFHFPIVLWVNDEILDKFLRIAPDLKSWAGVPIRFEPSDDELIDSLRQSTDYIFHEILKSPDITFQNYNLKVQTTVNLLNSLEFELFVRDLEHRKTNLESKADLQFLKIFHAYDKGKYDSAISFYEEYPSYWSQVDETERQGVIQYYAARCYKYKNDLKKAKLYFQFCIEAFKHRQNLAAKCCCEQGELLQESRNWDELENVAQKGLELNQACGNKAGCAECYRFLAEVELNRGKWKKAEELAQNALEAPSNEGRDKVRMTLAKIYQKLNQPEEAIKNLKLAREACKPESNPKLYIDILELLHDFYFEADRYIEAFRIKQEKLSLEQQFGFNAFIGAKPLKPRRWTHSNKTDIAKELQISERLNENVNYLFKRINRPDCKIIVLHGESGTGKTSILEAGLMPVMMKEAYKNREFLPILIRNYTDWAKSVWKKLSNSHLKETENEKKISSFQIENPFSYILDILRKKEKQNFLTVLIFDQFEEFFFTRPKLEDRIQFYTFIRDSLNISFVKIILSVREDYLHHLLECNRFADIDSINNNILDKKIRYHVGNFTPEDARATIGYLNERSNFNPESALIDKIIHDLTDEAGQIRPIELQILGSQLHTQKIKTLDAYKSKKVLLNGFLEEVIHDCGEKNKDVTLIVLYLLTNENNIRPLKTWTEITNELKKQDIKIESNQLDLVLEILKGSGIVSVIPERLGERYQIVHDYLVPLIREKAEPLIVYLNKNKVERELKEKAQIELREKELRQKIVSKGKELKLAMIIVFIVTCFAVAAAWFASEAERQSIIAKKETQRVMQYQQDELSRRLAFQALQQSEDQFDLSLLLSIEACNISSTFEARTAVMEMLYHQPYISSIMHGHSFFVTSLSFSLDGKLLASASYDKSIILWDVEKRQTIGSLIGHNSSVKAVSFSPNGKLLASGGDDNRIILWDIKNKQPIGKPLTGHKSYVESLAFSPCGKFLASGSRDNTIIFWDVEKHKPIGQPLKGHKSQVSSLSFSPDGKLLASGSWDKSIILWDVETRNPIAVLRGHEGSVSSVSFSPGGKFLASGSLDKSIILWNIETLKPIGFPLKKHEAGIRSVSFSPDGKFLASGDSNNTIILWDMMKRKSVGQPLKGHKSKISSVTFSPDGKTLASGSWDEKVILWDIKKRTFNEQIFKGHKFDIFSVSFSPNGKILASGSQDNTIILWNLETGQPIGKPLAGHKHDVFSVSFSPDGKILASGSQDDTIILWNVETLQPIGKPLTGHKFDIFSVAFSPDGKILASGSQDNTIILWNVETLQPIGKPLTGHEYDVFSVSFSPDGKILASGSQDNTIILWDVEKRQPIGKPLTGHKHDVFSVSFSPDGKTLASGSKDKTIILWDVKTQMSIAPPFKSHTFFVRSVVFSPDGKTLISGSDGSFFDMDKKKNHDNTIILWDVKTRLPIGQSLKGHEYPVLTLAVSPDGKVLASGSSDNTVKLWDISLESWKKRACQIANRNMTVDEWKKYMKDEPYRKICPDIP
ncbi:MAG: hypothetical protein GY795_04970 [Desulfobacterales bacterium]|nr:hypothetical protein [Desulfobacterales bacterium]